MAASQARRPVSQNPLAPLLRRLSEQFINESDLRSRFHSLFKVFASNSHRFRASS
jgi:hypothetical protein